MIGEADYKNAWQEVSNKSQGDSGTSHRSSNLQLNSESAVHTPFIFIIDDAQRMCQTSWLLLECVIRYSTRLAIFLATKFGKQEVLKVDPEAFSAFKRALSTIKEDQNIYFREIDVP